MISQKCWPSPSSLVPLMAAVPQLYSMWKLTFRLSQLSRVAEDLFRSSHTQSKSAGAEEARAGGYAGRLPVPHALCPPPVLTLVLLPTTAVLVLATVRCVQAAAEGGLTLAVTVTEGLPSHRHGAGDGRWQGGGLRVGIGVTVLQEKDQLLPPGVPPALRCHHVQVDGTDAPRKHLQIRPQRLSLGLSTLVQCHPQWPWTPPPPSWEWVQGLHRGSPGAPLTTSQVGLLAPAPPPAVLKQGSTGQTLGPFLLQSPCICSGPWPSGHHRMGGS